MDIQVTYVGAPGIKRSTLDRPDSSIPHVLRHWSLLEMDKCMWSPDLRLAFTLCAMLCTLTPVNVTFDRVTSNAVIGYKTDRRESSVESRQDPSLSWIRGFISLASQLRCK